MKVVDQEPVVRVMEGSWSADSVIQEVVDSGQEEPFYVMDIGEVVNRYNNWKELMPRVDPFYAVKCNDDKVLIRTLAALGAGFDCASKAEIELITSMGVKPERIIFANPAKMASHIRYSSSVGVDTMTFDSETELVKIKQYMPHAKLVIRIRCDAAAAQCPLGIKFGCDPVTEAPRLLKFAAVLQLEVIGVSFHVGSGAQETEVYARAVRYSRALFTLGAALGHAGMRLLDVGGGFPGGAATSIAQVAQVINQALETHFPEPHVRVIAEPGRYFAAAAYTLATCVHAKREVNGKEYGSDEDESHTMYFINDGVYGSFNCVLYDHQNVVAEPLNAGCGGGGGALQWSSVWGPTCDGLDVVVRRARLPALRPGAWLLFRDMGAYTLPVASPFNGFPVPTVRYVLSQKMWSLLQDVLPTCVSSWRVECEGPTPPASPSPPDSPAPTPPLASSTEHLQTIFVECALK